MSIIESAILIILAVYFVATSMKIFKLNSEAYEIQKQAFEREKEIEEIEQKLKSMYVVTECKDCKYIKAFDFYGEERFQCDKDDNSLGDVSLDDYCSKAERKDNENDI